MPRAERSPSGASHVRAGPQALQAIGSAWNRRSPGSSYSAAQVGHRSKPAIVVVDRSYGRDLMMV